jgi:hypothetical protein
MNEQMRQINVFWRNFFCTISYRQDELVGFMASLGYGCTVQDRGSSRFSICNITFYRESKLVSTWSESRSRALLCEFELKPEGPETSGTAADGASSVEVTLGGRQTHGTVVDTQPRIHLANVHLEGHPYKSKERLNQMKSLLSRLQLRLEQGGISVDDAMLLIAGVPLVLIAYFAKLLL